MSKDELFDGNGIGLQTCIAYQADFNYYKRWLTNFYHDAENHKHSISLLDKWDTEVFAVHNRTKGLHENDADQEVINIDADAIDIANDMRRLRLSQVEGNESVTEVADPEIQSHSRPESTASAQVPGKLSLAPLVEPCLINPAVRVQDHNIDNDSDSDQSFYYEPPRVQATAQAQASANAPNSEPDSESESQQNPPQALTLNVAMAVIQPTVNEQGNNLIFHLTYLY